jgi:hypothetical protein
MQLRGPRLSDDRPLRPGSAGASIPRDPRPPLEQVGLTPSALAHAFSSCSRLQLLEVRALERGSVGRLPLGSRCRPTGDLRSVLKFGPQAVDASDLGLKFLKLP